MTPLDVAFEVADDHFVEVQRLVHGQDVPLCLLLCEDAGTPPIWKLFVAPCGAAGEPQNPIVSALIPFRHALTLVYVALAKPVARVRIFPVGQASHPNAVLREGVEVYIPNENARSRLTQLTSEQ